MGYSTGTLGVLLCVVVIYTTQSQALKLSYGPASKPFYYPGAKQYYHGSSCHTGYVYRTVKRNLYINGGSVECFGKVKDVYCHGACTKYQYKADIYKEKYYLTKRGLQYLLPYYERKDLHGKGQGKVTNTNSLSKPDHAHDKGQGPADHAHDKGQGPADHAHDKGQGPADHTHDKGQGTADHAHDKGQGPTDHAHDKGQAPADHTHDKGQGPADHAHDKGQGPTDHTHDKGQGPVDHTHEGQGPADHTHDKGQGPADHTHDEGQGPADHSHEGQGHTHEGQSPADHSHVDHHHHVGPSYCCAPAAPRWRLIRLSLQCGYYWKGIVMFHKVSPGCVCTYC